MLDVLHQSYARVPLQGLLATNPNNPLGTIYRPETLLEALRWCLDHGVHFIRWRWAVAGWRQGRQRVQARSWLAAQRGLRWLGTRVCLQVIYACNRCSQPRPSPLPSPCQ